MLKVTTYSAKGVRDSEVTLPKEFDVKENLAILAQAIRVYGDRRHPGNAMVKTRAEVDRTKKKLYKQKGTGGARHGSRRAPIFVGGGVTHGPRGLKRELTMPAKMRRRALAVAISLAVKEKRVIVYDFSKLEKAKEIVKLTGKRNLFVLDEGNKKVSRFLRNIDSSKVVFFKNLNAYDVFFGGNVILDKGALVEKKVSASKGEK